MCSEENGDFAGHLPCGKWFESEVRDGVAPFSLGAALKSAVIDDGGSEGASDGEEYEPVARREFEAETGETYTLISE